MPMLSCRAVGLLLLLCSVMPSPATAQPRDVILWDQHIASAMHEALLSDQVCRQSPYSIDRPICGSRSFDLSIRQPITPNMHAIDRLAILVHRFKDINLDTEIEPGTEFKLKAKVANVYRHEAEIRLTLQIEF